MWGSGIVCRMLEVYEKQNVRGLRQTKMCRWAALVNCRARYRASSCCYVHHSINTIHLKKTKWNNVLKRRSEDIILNDVLKIRNENMIAIIENEYTRFSVPMDKCWSLKKWYNRKRILDIFSPDGQVLDASKVRQWRTNTQDFQSWWTWNASHHDTIENEPGIPGEPQPSSHRAQVSLPTFCY